MHEHFLLSFDYEKIREDDRVTLRGLSSFAPGQNLTLEVSHADGGKETIQLKHTFNPEQIKWFQAGSALNLLRSQKA